MPTVTRRRWAAVTLVVGLAAGVTGLASACTPTGNPDTPRAATSSVTSPLSTPAARTTGTPTAAGPPSGTIRSAGSIITSYGASRVSWADVIEQGRPIPPVSARCADQWHRSGPDPRLDWTSVEYLCLNALAGAHFRPQGIAGSATARHYSIGARPAAARRIVLVSRYSRAQLPGLVAPNRAGTSTTQLLVLDLDQRRYNTVELVKPDGRGRLLNLDSHGSGLAWAGQYLYSSSHAKLWMYNADDLLQISGRFVLPAVASWTARGRGGLSSISIDDSTEPARLLAINYARHPGHSYLNSYELAATGRLAPQPGGSSVDLTLTNRFGEAGRVVRSGSSRLIPGTKYQGVGSSGAYLFANSSGLRIGGRKHPRVDAAVVLTAGHVLGQVQMPDGNGESVYIDRRRGSYQSMVEDGGQFLFTIGLKQLVEAAQRR